MSMEGRELTAQELEQQDIIDLPDRKAMTLISTLPHLPTTLPESGDGGSLLGSADQPAGSTDTGGAPTDAVGATDVATDAAGSDSGSPSVTDQPRSEDFSSTHTATSTT